MRKNDCFPMTAENLGADLEGICRHEGMPVFVPGLLPGEETTVRIVKAEKRFAFGRMEAPPVLPSPDRRENDCPAYPRCGGCSGRHMRYEATLAAKRQQVEDQLVRIGHLDVPEIKPTLPSPHTEFYRNKLEFSASASRWILNGENPDALSANDRVGLGFHVSKFFDKVLDIKECHLQKEPSNAIRLFVKQFCLEHGYEFYNIRENRGFFRNMFVRTNDKGDVMLILCFAQPRMEDIHALLDAVNERFPQISSLWYIINGKLNDSISDQSPVLYKGEDAIYETMEGLSFKIGPKSFYQTNSEQAYRLYSVARDFAALTGNEVVYDLYTGTGTIAQFVSAKAAKVVGIEYVPEAIEDAKDNAKRNGITNCSFFAGDMKDVLNEAFIAKHGRPDVIILDPPRAGIHPDVAKVILGAAPGRMVYVSCNPASQARDLAILCTKYRITAVQPVDMFPHTMHVENVVALELI